MKKVLIIASLLLITFLFTGNVYAAEEVVAEESTFDNWVNIVTDFASLKNFILSVSGLTVLTMMLKVRSLYKFVKSPDGTNAIYNHIETFLRRISDKPELIMGIVNVFAQLPIVKQLGDRALKTADRIDLELEGKIIDLKAKLGADVFATVEDRQQAQTYLAKLVAEYENIKPSQ